MRRLDPTRLEALHDVGATRAIEQALAAPLPPHTLMAHAGESVARLARALHPHARCIWVACGPGNNGGDGLVAAVHLREWMLARGGTLVVTLDAEPSRMPADAAWALALAQAAGVQVAPEPPPDADLVVDALLGLGARADPDGPLTPRLRAVLNHPAPVLAVDLPSGLDADSGQHALADARSAAPRGPRHTLSLLTLKPGLFTAHGRDMAGEVWFDDLRAGDTSASATATWGGFGAQPDVKRLDPHAGHKGCYGDVGVLGGQLPGTQGIAMAGAAVLAARAALHAGAGRVFVALVGDDPVPPWIRCNPS